MTHSTVRLGNGKLDALTELHGVNHSPENRFEARPLRENSTATGTFRVTFAIAKNAGVRLSTGGRIFMSKNLTSVRSPSGGRGLRRYFRDGFLSLFDGPSYFGHQMFQIVLGLKLRRLCVHFHVPICCPPQRKALATQYSGSK